MNSNNSLNIDDSVLNKAIFYAKSKGVNLSSIVENFLSKWTSEQALKDKIDQFPISPEVKSLVGRMKEEGNYISWEQDKEAYFKDTDIQKKL